MSLSHPPSPAGRLEAQRERTVQVLCEHFARDHIADSELERRLDLVHRATAPRQLEEVVADLPGLTDAAPAGQAGPSPTPAAAARARQVLAAVFGGVERRGAWVPPRQLTAVAVMGGVVLDFREARLPPGGTDVQCFAFWGGVEILISPDIHVETDGLAIMGGFEQHGGAAGASPRPDAPVLRIGGLAIMAGVEVRVQLPGESAREARLRQAEERKRLKRGS
jgi:hypothetical protein